MQSPSDFYFIRLEDAEETAEYVVDLAAKLADTFGLDNIQVLAPMHKYITGVQNLNNSLQQRLNPPGSGKKEYPFRDSCFRIGDKVMAIRNNYEKGIFNGNQGLVLDIVLSQEDEDVDEDTIWVDFDGSPVPYTRSGWTNSCWPMPLRCIKPRAASFPSCVVVLSTRTGTCSSEFALYRCDPGQGTGFGGSRCRGPPLPITRFRTVYRLGSQAADSG